MQEEEGGSDRGFAAFAGADAKGVLDGFEEDLAVSGFAGASVLYDRLDDGVDEVRCALTGDGPGGTVEGHEAPLWISPRGDHPACLPGCDRGLLREQAPPAHELQLQDGGDARTTTSVGRAAAVR